MEKIIDFKFWIQTKMEALMIAKEIVRVNPEDAKLIEYEIGQYGITLRKLEEFEKEYSNRGF